MKTKAGWLVALAILCMGAVAAVTPTAFDALAARVARLDGRTRVLEVDVRALKARLAALERPAPTAAAPDESGAMEGTYLMLWDDVPRGTVVMRERGDMRFINMEGGKWKRKGADVRWVMDGGAAVMHMTKTAGRMEGTLTWGGIEYRLVAVRQ